MNTEVKREPQAQNKMALEPLPKIYRKKTYTGAPQVSNQTWDRETRDAIYQKILKFLMIHTLYIY